MNGKMIIQNVQSPTSTNSFNYRSDQTETSGILGLAKAFLYISSMTHKKLQKLCFYAKAWYLALYDENLIDDEFEAWVHGAVQPRLYQVYKHYGFEPIPKLDSCEGIPEEYISFAKDIYDVYGKFTGNDLEYINHREDPWINARHGLKPWENSSNKISESDMKDYYRRRIDS